MPQVSSYIPAHPWHLEAFYTRQLARRIAIPLMRITWQELKPVVYAYRAPSERTDDLHDFFTAIGKAQLRFAQEVNVDREAEDAIHETAPKVESFTLAQQRRSLRVLGVETPGIGTWKELERVKWSDENRKLIKSIPQEFYPRLQKQVTEAVHAGMRHETLAKAIQTDFLPQAKNRAALIARDQVSKYNGALAKSQQQSVGIDSYQWRAVHDRRTRETHLALDMTTQKWADPPSIGHPGESVQCRCVAVALL